jgi:hypothetical protein
VKSAFVGLATPLRGGAHGEPTHWSKIFFNMSVSSYIHAAAANKL